MEKLKITVEATVIAEVQKVWEYWTRCEHVMRWNHASDDWHCPAATNPLHVGGKFVYTMAARDGSVSFDFEGVHSEVVTHKKIATLLADGREMVVEFKKEDGKTLITETFEAEDMNPTELQRAGWQAILNNFKAYVEAN